MNLALLVPLSLLAIVISTLVIYQVWRLNRRRRERVAIPWVLLLAWRKHDERARTRVEQLQKKLITSFNRDYQLSLSSVEELIVKAIDDTAAAYHPEAEEPIRQLSVKQLNALLNRILARLQDLFALYPFSLLSGTTIGTMQFVFNSGQAVMESSPVKFIKDSPVGGLLKKIPFGKIAQGIRMSRKVTTPMGVVLEVGRQLSAEGIKRLVLREIAGIAYRESIRTFSGGEVYDDQQRQQLLACWLVADQLGTEQESDAALRWLTGFISGMKRRPDTLARYILLMALDDNESDHPLSVELYARYRQARKRLPADQRHPGPAWRRLLQAESLAALDNEPEAVVFRETVADLVSNVPDDSQLALRFKALLGAAV